MRICQPPTDETVREAVAAALEKGRARYRRDVELQRDVDIQEIKRTLRRLSPVMLRVLAEAVRQLPSWAHNGADGNRPLLRKERDR